METCIDFFCWVWLNSGVFWDGSLVVEPQSLRRDEARVDGRLDHCSFPGFCSHGYEVGFLLSMTTIIPRPQPSGCYRDRDNEGATGSGYFNPNNDLSPKSLFVRHRQNGGVLLTVESDLEKKTPACIVLKGDCKLCIFWGTQIFLYSYLIKPGEDKHLRSLFVLHLDWSVCWILDFVKGIMVRLRTEMKVNGSSLRYLWYFHVWMFMV